MSNCRENESLSPWEETEAESAGTLGYDYEYRQQKSWGSSQFRILHQKTLVGRGNAPCMGSWPLPLLCDPGT